MNTSQVTHLKSSIQEQALGPYKIHMEFLDIMHILLILTNMCIGLINIGIYELPKFAIVISTYNGHLLFNGSWVIHDVL